MGKLQTVRLAIGALLVGSVALAQQGLITEPWRKAPPPAAAAVPPLRAMPASGLGPAGANATSARNRQPASPIPSPAATVLRWSPPVVELLVDPWAKRQAAAPAGPRWVPPSVEIVDPWADEPAPEHRVASRQPSPPRSTIF